MTIERLQLAIQHCWKVHNFLAAAVEGGPIEARHDKYLLVENPQFRPDDGSDPKLVFDLGRFGCALAEIESLKAELAAAPAPAIQALEDEMVEAMREAYLLGRSQWCPAGILKDEERTERDWLKAKEELEAALSQEPAPGKEERS